MGWESQTKGQLDDDGHAEANMLRREVIADVFERLTRIPGVSVRQAMSDGAEREAIGLLLPGFGLMNEGEWVSTHLLSGMRGHYQENVIDALLLSGIYLGAGFNPDSADVSTECKGRIKEALAHIARWHAMLKEQ
jgi:hypothetical protein